MKTLTLRRFTPKRTFGIEMEWANEGFTRERMRDIIQAIPGERAIITGYQPNNDPALWFCKTDSSCGLEMATKVLGSLDSSEKTVKDLEIASQVHQNFYQHGARVNENCGGHIHVCLANHGDNNGQTDARTVKFLLYWIKMEKFFMDLVPRRRVGNRYCATHSGFFKAGTSYTDINTIRGAFSARAAVNLCHYAWGNGIAAGQKRIEIRLPEGSNDTRDMKNWVRILLQLIDRADALPAPTNVNWLTLEESLEVLGLYNQPDAEEFVILDSSLQELREWILNRTAAYAKFRDARVLRTKAKELREKLYKDPPTQQIQAEVLP